MNFHAALSTYALDADDCDWIPVADGIALKPLAFLPNNEGWVQLLRLEPGAGIPRHRHTGEVHAFNLAGQRMILGSERVIGPFGYVHESAGDVDSWQAIGDEPCVIYVEVRGSVEYLDADDGVRTIADAEQQRQIYLKWCAGTGRQPRPELVRRAD